MLAAPAIVRAQGGALKVGVLLPRSGVQAGIGQDCFRGVELTNPILKDLGLAELQIMNADTETNVEVARSRAEKLIADGAQLLVGAFDSGQSTAIAQVAEQKGIPYVINIAAAPPITEQGYKFVFRNFPTAPMILNDAFTNQKEIFEAAGAAPKTVVFMHVNDTFGTAMAGGIGGILPRHNMPFTIKETISYDPGGARSLGRGRQGEGVRRRSADGGQPPQRCDPADARARQAALESDGHPVDGPRLVRRPVSQDARQARRRAVELRAVVRPEQEAVARRSRTRSPRSIRRSISTPTTSIPSRRCSLRPTPTSAPARPIRRRSPTRSARPTSRTTSRPAPASRSTPRARTSKLKNSGIQNRGGKLVTVAPKGATNAKAEWPMTGYDKRS